MDSLQDLMSTYRRDEPEAIRAVKHYIDEQFHASATVAIKGEALVITVSSAALANTLRFHTLKLQTLCPDFKRLIFRIG
jgi:hypothetical protein